MGCDGVGTLPVSDLERDARGRQMLAGLLAASHLMPLELLPAAVTEHAAPVGFRRVLIYVGDLQRDLLRLLTGEGLNAGAGTTGEEPELEVEGSLAGRSYQYGEILPEEPTDTGEQNWWVPLVDGTERLGVLRITTADDGMRARVDMTLLAALVALILHGKERSSDALARLTRVKPLNIAAEMQWNLMPPRSYADGRVMIAASMEPAYTISGDAYDYATVGPVIHLSVFDAMGHDTAAGLTANLAVAACRNSRRQGLGLAETSERVERSMIEQYGHRSYATGVIADLGTQTGLLTWVNRGHHPPVLIRDGRWHSHLSCQPAHPMGTGLGLPAKLCSEQLEPGDPAR